MFSVFTTFFFFSLVVLLSSAPPSLICRRRPGGSSSSITFPLSPTVFQSAVPFVFRFLFLFLFPSLSGRCADVQHRAPARIRPPLAASVTMIRAASAAQLNHLHKSVHLASAFLFLHPSAHQDGIVPCQRSDSAWLCPTFPFPGRRSAGGYLCLCVRVLFSFLLLQYLSSPVPTMHTHLVIFFCIYYPNANLGLEFAGWRMRRLAQRDESEGGDAGQGRETRKGAEKRRKICGDAITYQCERR